MGFDCFLCGKELLCMDSTAHEMKGPGTLNASSHKAVENL